MGKKREIILVPFGPTRSIPPGYDHCFACDGSGKSSMDWRKKCKPCRGKGYHNHDDMMIYHKDCTEESCMGDKYGCGVKWVDRMKREEVEYLKKCSPEKRKEFEEYKKMSDSEKLKSLSKRLTRLKNKKG